MLLSMFRQNSDGTADPELLQSWRGALRVLLAGYGATLGAEDRVTLRALRALDAALHGAVRRSAGGPQEANTGNGFIGDGAAAAEVSALFSGPLAQSG